MVAVQVRTQRGGGNVLDAPARISSACPPLRASDWIDPLVPLLAFLDDRLDLELGLRDPDPLIHSGRKAPRRGRRFITTSRIVGREQRARIGRGHGHPEAALELLSAAEPPPAGRVELEVEALYPSLSPQEASDEETDAVGETDTIKCRTLAIARELAGMLDGVDERVAVSA